MPEKKGVVRQLNSGFKLAKGEIIAFLDDDAIADQNWIKRHVDAYSKPNVGGMAGNVIRSKLIKGKIVVLSGEPSEVISIPKKPQKNLGSKVWNCPLKGLRNLHVLHIKSWKSQL